MNTNEWDILYILPNLVLNQSYGNEYISIVPFNSSRLQNILKYDKCLSTFIGNFFDHRQSRIKPSALIYNKQLMNEQHLTEAASSFRNILAISVLPLECTAISYGRYPNSPTYRWSDSFDFYPVTYNEGRFFTNEPGYRSFSSKGLVNIYGHTTPHVYRPHSINKILIDEEIYHTLSDCWRFHFIELMSTPNLISLFRSLELANHALASPRRNNHSLYDLGVAVTLWVSAIETLVYPLFNEAKRKYVSQLLGSYIWSDDRLNNKTWSYDTYSQNLIQRAYYYLFDLRNLFSHGDPVHLNMFRPYGRINLNLIDFAPILYRTVLYAYLKSSFELAKVSNVSEYITTARIEQQLLRIDRFNTLKKVIKK